MISSEQLLAEMDQQVHLAKQATSEQTRREAVAAVRALCNVLLRDDKPLPVETQASPSIATWSEQPIQEADANGESLFDF